MRGALSFALLAAVAAEQPHRECPIKKIIEWIQEHGPEVTDSIQECKDVPSIIMKAKAKTGCFAQRSVADKAAVGLWYAITGLEHMNNTKLSDFAKHSLLMKGIKKFSEERAISMAHEGASLFCGNTTCVDTVKEVQTKISSCYAAIGCSFWDKALPRDSCKSAVDKYMQSTITIATESMCKFDEARTWRHPIDGAKVYCGELQNTLMFEDVDCFMERQQAAGPLAKCTPQCMKEWDQAKYHMPKCSKIIEDMPNQIFDQVKVMLTDMSKDSKIDMKKIIDSLPKHLPTYDDKCSKSVVV